jgi:hypothetical protein
MKDLTEEEPTRLWEYVTDDRFMRDGTKAVYDDIAKPTGMMSFAPLERDRGRMFSARSRLGIGELECRDPRG